MSVRAQCECSCTKRNANPERMCKVNPPEECTESWENALALAHLIMGLQVLYDINEVELWFLKADLQCLYIQPALSVQPVI